MKNNTTILIDGKFYIYRALSANFSLTHNDLNTTIYYNFLSAMKAIAKKFKTGNLIIMWDSATSYRKQVYPEYKIPKNKTIDKNLEEQKNIIKFEYDNIKENLKKIGFASYNRFGYEADDLFFFYINKFKKDDIIIVSRDEDLYQLLTFDNARLYNPHLKQFVDRKYIKNKYGLTPEQWALYKSINGCTSDQVPGIPTIGEKSTIQYITQTASPKIINTIRDNWNIVTRNMFLVTLPFVYPSITKIPKTFKPKETIINLKYLEDFCFQMGFKSFLKDLDDWKIFKVKE